MSITVKGRTIYNPHPIVTNGLIIYVDAGNKRSYPLTGNTWYDISGNNFNFSSTVPPTFKEDSVGRKCFDFTNGNGEYFDSITTSPFSGNLFAITVSAILNQNSVGNFHGVLTQNEGDTNNSMGFISYDGKFGTDHWNPGGRRLVSAANQNQIYMVTWVIPKWVDHQTDTTIYLNGTSQPTEIYSTDTTGSLVSDYLRIGNWQLNRSDMDFDGQIYSIMVYDRVLSDAEIDQNYNSMKRRFSI